ncbi:hypothetical protein MASR2M17_05240 [Aminivibrio sp.]
MGYKEDFFALFWVFFENPGKPRLIGQIRRSMVVTMWGTIPLFQKMKKDSVAGNDDALVLNILQR